LLELGDKFNGLERNVKLGGYSNCTCINDMGFYNPHKSINGNLYIYFIFTSQDGNRYRDPIDGLGYGETVDILKYIKK
jgi:hypothetical protein